MLQSLQSDRIGLLILSIGLAGLLFGLAMGSGFITIAGAIGSVAGLARLFSPSLRRRFDPYDLKKLQNLEFDSIEQQAGSLNGDAMCPRCGELYSSELPDCPRCRPI